MSNNFTPDVDPMDPMGPMGPMDPMVRLRVEDPVQQGFRDAVHKVGPGRSQPRQQQQQQENKKTLVTFCTSPLGISLASLVVFFCTLLALQPKYIMKTDVTTGVTSVNFTRVFFISVACALCVLLIPKTIYKALGK